VKSTCFGPRSESRPDFCSIVQAESESGLRFPPRETRHFRCFAARKVLLGVILQRFPTGALPSCRNAAAASRFLMVVGCVPDLAASGAVHPMQRGAVCPPARMTSLQRLTRARIRILHEMHSRDQVSILNFVHKHARFYGGTKVGTGPAESHSVYNRSIIENPLSLASLGERPYLEVRVSDFLFRAAFQKNLRTRPGHETIPESSSERINPITINSKASPTHLEGVSGPRGDLRNRIVLFPKLII
jgi:hypothetical protein